jgi:hypothetical protein
MVLLEVADPVFCTQFLYASCDTLLLNAGTLSNILDSTRKMLTPTASL